MKTLELTPSEHEMILTIKPTPEPKPEPRIELIPKPTIPANRAQYYC